MTDPLIAGLTLMRRMPPNEAEKTLAGLNHLIEDPDTIDQLYQRVDKPLKVAKCQTTGNEFICCEFNRDGDSYRSPWSNQFQPAAPDAVVPEGNIRAFEQKAGETFAEYVRLYYEGGLHSVYAWEIDPENFACAFLVKKDIQNLKHIDSGTWESSSLVSVSLQNNKATYQVTSTVFLRISVKTAGTVDLAGTLSKQKRETKTIPARNPESFHIYAILSVVEELENELRSELDAVYTGKTQEIIDRTRHLEAGKSYGMKLPS